MKKIINCFIKTKQKYLTIVTISVISVLSIICLSNIISNTQTAEASPTTSSLQQKMDELQPVLNQTSNDYYLAQQEADKTQAAVDETQANIDYYNERIPVLKQSIAANSVKEYKDGPMDLGILLAEHKSLFDMLKDIQLLEVVNEKKNKDIKECNNLRHQLEESIVSLQELNNQKQDALTKAANAQAEANNAMSELEIAFANATAEEIAALQAIPMGMSESASYDGGSSWSGGGESSDGGGGGSWSGGGGGGSSHGSWNGWGGWTGPGWLPRDNWPMTGNPVADRALSMIGRPYVWGAVGPDSFDCSGLVSYAVTGQFGNRIGWTGSFVNYTPCEPYVGAICIVHQEGNPSKQHCGIFVGWDAWGNPCMCHAPTFGDRVRVTTVMPEMMTVCP